MKYHRIFEEITKNKIDFIFAFIFVFLLFIPMSHISKAQLSNRENRMLAKQPEFIIDGKINTKFGSQFDTWFQDRFCGREQIIRLYGHIQNWLLFSSNKKVLIGKDGWLFTKGNNSLDNFQNKTPFSEEELQHIAKYVSDIDSWATQNGKTFYYFIAPDKNKIYGENITTLKKARPDTESKVNQLVKYLQQHTKVKVLYLYEPLISNKDKGLLYYKNDTHWNDFGAYLAYQEIVKTIKKQHKNLSPVKYDSIEYKTYERGDLTNMLAHGKGDKTTEYAYPIIKDNSNCEYSVPDKDEMEPFVCYNKNKKLKVFMLRDSFTTALKQYLNNTFNTVDYRFRQDITTDDLDYIKNNSDIIILEQVERLVPALLHYKFPKD